MLRTTSIPANPQWAVPVQRRPDDPRYLPVVAFWARIIALFSIVSAISILPMIDLTFYLGGPQPADVLVMCVLTIPPFIYLIFSFLLRRIRFTACHVLVVLSGLNIVALIAAGVEGSSDKRPWVAWYCLIAAGLVCAILNLGMNLWRTFIWLRTSTADQTRGFEILPNSNPATSGVEKRD